MNFGGYGYNTHSALESSFSNLHFGQDHSINGSSTGNNGKTNMRNNGLSLDDTSPLHLPQQGHSMNNYSNNDTTNKKNNKNNCITTNNNNINTTAGTSNNNNNNDLINTLNLNLQMKDTQIESLENEIRSLKKLLNPQRISNNSLSDATNGKDLDIDTELLLPRSIESLYNELSSKLLTKEEELMETNDNLESLITSITLNPTNSITKNGRYDIETIAHKMIVKLEILNKENKEMAKMISYGRSKELQIELNLAQLENAKLKEENKLLSFNIDKFKNRFKIMEQKLENMEERTLKVEKKFINDSPNNDNSSKNKKPKK